jgi:uncharacterized membrane protein YphA (DoxX/SURF4 family)
MNTKNSGKNKVLNIVLWIAQGVLAAMFLMSGFMKVAQPIAELSKMLPWASEMPAGLVRFIGFSELAGGIGLLLPSILRFKPKLTAWAAVGLIAVMAFATIFHISRGETGVIGMNIVLMLIAIFIAWGRFKKVPIAEKGHKPAFS